MQTIGMVSPQEMIETERLVIRGWRPEERAELARLAQDPEVVRYISGGVPWDDARIDELLTLVELEPEQFRDRPPEALSGGQQQRVGLARALAAEPELMLLDEPFGALDPLTRDRLQQEFQQIRRSLGLTAIFVTHDMVEALVLGDRIAVLDAGRLAQVGTPGDLLRSPANDYVAGLMETPRRQAAVVDRFLAGEPS